MVVLGTSYTNFNFAKHYFPSVGALCTSSNERTRGPPFPHTTAGRCYISALSSLMSYRRRLMSPSQQAQANPATDETQHDQQTRAGADFDVDELEQHLAAHEPKHQRHGRLEVRQLAHRLRDDDVNAPQSHDGEKVARKHNEGILCGPTDTGRTRTDSPNRQRRQPK